MAIPVFLFTVDAFERGMAPFDKLFEGFVNAAEAQARFDAIVAQAKDQCRPDSPIQRVVLRRHRLDVDKPLAMLAASLVSDCLNRDEPPWAVATTTTARYHERPRSTP